MSFLTKHLTQAATYWKVNSKDSSGDSSYAAPRNITVRWEERSLAFTNALGKEGVAAASVWVREDMNEGDYLLLGISTTADPLAVIGSREVQGFSKLKQLVGGSFERKAFLSARLR